MRCDCGTTYTADVAPRPRLTKQEAADAVAEILFPRFEVTDKGKAEVESDAMVFLRRRIELSGRLSLIEQASWRRDRKGDTDSSSAQPHRFRTAD